MRSTTIGLSQNTPAFLRFGAVGLVTTGTHILIATRLLEVGGLHPAIANTVAFLVATVLGYGLNTYWSFQSRNNTTVIMRYLAVTSMGALSCATLSAIAHVRGVHPWFAIVATILVVPLVTFILHQQWTYRSSELSKMSDVTDVRSVTHPIHTILSIAVLCALVLVLHGATLQGHWRWDDGTNLLRATQYSLTDLFTDSAVLRHASGNQLAPFNLAIYIVNLRIFGLEPFWFYAQHLIMLAAAGVAFLALLRLWLHPFAALTGAALMLAGLPVSQMAEQLMVGHYILGLIFVCAMFWAYARGLSIDQHKPAWAYSLLAAIAYALACLSKEVYVPAVLLLPFLPNLGNRPFQPSQMRFAIPSFLVASAYALIRWNMFQGLGGYHSGSFNAQAFASITGVGTTLLGMAWAGEIALLLLVCSIIAMLWTNPLRRLSLLFALIVGVGAPIAILAASQPDWGQHARYLFLPWVLVCLSWAVWLSPTKKTTSTNNALKASALVGFVLAVLPAAQARFAQDHETHAMFDAYSRHVVGPQAGHPMLPTLINAPGYLTAVLSAANAAHRQKPPAGTQPPHTLNTVYPVTLTDIPPNTMTWQPSCACLVPWSQLPPPLQATRLQQQQIKLLLALPIKAPLPPLADGVGGQIEMMDRQGTSVEMRGWLPTSGVGTVLFLIGSQSPILGLDLALKSRDSAREKNFVLRFSVPDSFSEQTTHLCLVGQSQKVGEEELFKIIRWADEATQAHCAGLLNPAAQRLSRPAK